ncbi:MAG: endonuclease/exonuclease/phosphatase family protein [Propionibacteriaceae bacterium]|jgi:endonuclease/exonuclease/phosphatase family metal-dependent hydrolase|nr:endonuclease/exonuclease/phosphatase family protein [Propionibacteriaceae bacterium]
MRKRILAGLAIAVLLAGCAGGQPGDAPAASGPQSAVETVAAPAAEAPSVSETAEPAATAADAQDPAAEPEPPAQVASPLALTVMTYNTLTGKNDCAGCLALQKAGDGAQLELSARMPGVAEKVLLEDPDIVGFQENEGVEGEKLPAQYLQPLLPGYTWVLPEATVPIMVRSSLFQVLDSGIVTLEKDKGPCTAKDKTQARYVSWAKLSVAADGSTLWVFNTHGHPYDELACAKLRSQNVDKILKLMEAKNPGQAERFVLVGDFNAYSDETRKVFRDHLAKLGKVGIVDSFDLAQSDDSDVENADSASWMSAKVAGKSRVRVIRRDGRHIDYVFVKEGTQVSSWKVLAGPGVEWETISGEKVPYWPGIIPSDHNPVIAKITLS